MPEQTQTSTTGQRKREVAHKLNIGNILQGNPIVEETTTDAGQTRENFKILELGDKQILRVNIIANVIEKYIAEGEKRWASITLDDASGQINIKVFGDDTAKFQDINQGDTLLIIGVLRSFNKELYILPEVIKKQDPKYLLVRKLEIDSSQPLTSAIATQTPEAKAEASSTREQIITLIKESEADGGIDTEQIILKLKDISPDNINSEIKKLLEDGVIYEPRPGRVRYLG